MKWKAIIGTAMASTLLLAGCSSDEEANESKEAENEISVEEKIESNAQVEQSEDSFDNLREEYHEMAKTLKEFELPKEGRLSKEEVEEQFHVDDASNSIGFENGYVFEEDTKKLDHVEYTKEFELHEPKGTQSLGYLMVIISEIDNEHTSVRGNTVEEIEEVSKITDLDRQYMKEQLKLTEEERSKSERTFKHDVDQKVANLNRVEPHVKDEQISEWIEETKNHLVEANEQDFGNWEEGYNHYKQAVDNYEKMKIVVNEVLGE